MGFYGILWDFMDFMVVLSCFFGGLMGFYGIDPLVDVYITIEHQHVSWVSQLISTINGHFQELYHFD